ncbi:sensor histidine kinase [Haloarchaeobius iranensis]|uniref:histidine kinase n=1 Tax=Haloarchaeobius iranensis TaxID=996166 RepID=A0A1G9TRT7_9EURY|nr:histidine kinase N-terminal 7TM domain-containing protein [Haloarchaeobius iranensis]SDM50410.1 N-terminal 7TM region of histidine kinase [Haloarchaeobius iranensis]
MEPLPDVSTVRIGYVLAFTVATVATLGSVPRARTIDHEGTRRGLVGVLVASGLWAATHAAFVALPPGEPARVVYIGGLAVGFSTVFAWLYFCSAYTGRDLHRDPVLRRVGLGTYLAVVLVKLTNPLHGYYFTVEPVSTPFSHLAVQQGVLHWVATGLSYVLAGVGLFMLFERFRDANYDTRGVSGLVALTAVPVAADLLGYATPVLLDVIYAPLGVAAFAVGVLYVYDDRFLSVQLTGDVGDGIVLLDDDRRVVEANDGARVLFPDLRGASGRPASAVDGLSAALDADGSIVDRPVDGETRHFLVNASSFSLGGSDIGRLLLFSDVTRIERERREVARHNDQLEGFTEGIRHELRNAVAVVEGYVDLAADRLDAGEVTRANEALQEASGMAARMSRTVDDLATVAEHGRTVDDTTWVDFRDAVAEARDQVDTGDASVVVVGDGQVAADPTRLQQLFENALRFASREGSTTVRLELREDGFVVTDDGTTDPDADPEAFFDYGDAVPTASATVTLPTVRTLARVHGWSATVDTTYETGVRVVVEGVDVRLVEAETEAAADER